MIVKGNVVFIRLPYGMTHETMACINCKHFYPHFSYTGDMLPWGHCTYPRCKHRRVDQLCEHFVFRKREEGELWRESIRNTGM